MNCEEIGIIQQIKRGNKIANFAITVPKSLDIQKKALLVGAAIYMVLEYYYMYLDVIYFFFLNI